SRAALSGFAAGEPRPENRSGGSCDVASCANSFERSSAAMLRREPCGDQSRFKEPDRKLRKKIGGGKGANFPVRLPHGEERGRLPQRKWGDAENCDPAEHGLRDVRQSPRGGF